MDSKKRMRRTKKKREKKKREKRDVRRSPESQHLHLVYKQNVVYGTGAKRECANLYGGVDDLIIGFRVRV